MFVLAVYDFVTDMSMARHVWEVEMKGMIVVIIVTSNIWPCKWGNLHK